MRAADLRRLLAAPTPMPSELLLRTEMRRAILELSGVLSDAAAAEPSRSKAAEFRAASVMAAELAARPAAASAARRDH